jgi:hypothetical protein
MRSVTKTLGAGLLLVILFMPAIDLLAAPRSKGNGRATKGNGKTVTVTLVRWPYT